MNDHWSGVTSSGNQKLWEKDRPLPCNWIPLELWEPSYFNVYELDPSVHVIKKVDNLTWVEYLAKSRHLV